MNFPLAFYMQCLLCVFDYCFSIPLIIFNVDYYPLNGFYNSLMCFSLKFEGYLLGAWIQLEVIYMNVTKSIFWYYNCKVYWVLNSGHIFFFYLILIISWARSSYFLHFTHKIKEAMRLNVLLRVLYPECSRLGILTGSLLCPPVCEKVESKLVPLQCATKPSQAEPLSSGHRIKLGKCAREPTSPAGLDLGKGASWTKCMYSVTNFP